MKREYVNQENFSSSGSCPASEKGKMWGCEEEDAGDDELFAALGYFVKASDMAEVVQKIQRIEAMGDDELSHLASDSVHCNPSNLSSWLDSVHSNMVSGVNPSPGFESSPDGSTVTCISPQFPVELDFGSDLIAIPGKAVYPPAPPRSKKVKTSPRGGYIRRSESARSLLVDSQENGIKLVHTLMACAEAVQQENFKVAEALVKSIVFLAVSQAGAMGKVATYFAKALAQRICKLYPPDSAYAGGLQMHFYEACPYLKFAHFTANLAIHEAFKGKKRVHVIDFSTNQGMQWPPLLQALAQRPGGAPSFRLTGIGPPSRNDTDPLQETGFKLAQFAETVNVEFDYRGYVANSLSDLDASIFDIREGEIVAVNSILDLHPLLAKPGSIDKVLQLVRKLQPAIFTVVENEANHNESLFVDRFTEALHYYSTMFDSLESGAAAGEDKSMSEKYLGQQIWNVVACEGLDRVERHEPLSKWRSRFASSGFEPVHLGSDVYKHAIMVLEATGGDGYSVEENGGCLMLGWHTRPLIAASAWKLGRKL